MQTPQIPLDRARDLVYRARCVGAAATPLHGDCTVPVYRDLRGVQSLALSALAQLADPFDSFDVAEGYGIVPGQERAPPAVLTAVVSVRCRKCPECLNAKRRLWSARAFTEVERSVRTWFGTLTVAPEHRFRAQLLAERRSLTARREPLEALTELERFKAISACLVPEVTKWFKRVRKSHADNSLRYLLVAEAHKDGFPHFHLLLHERGQPVTKRTLEAQWSIGHSHWRLVPAGNETQVRYVTKYIAKDFQTRVRASKSYGERSSSTELATRFGMAQAAKPV